MISARSQAPAWERGNEEKNDLQSRFNGTEGLPLVPKPGLGNEEKNDLQSRFTVKRPCLK
jgi:hypothetical protein